MAKGCILIANINKLAQKSLYELLCRNQYKVEIADSSHEAIAHLNENPYHVILTEASEPSAVEFLKAINEKGYPSKVIVLTSCGNIETAVSSMRSGAFDYLVRPVEDDKIISTIERAVASHAHIGAKFTFFGKSQGEDNTYYGLVGKNRAMQEIYTIIERIANSKATVLLRGESGTGKRLIAHALHKADKKRKNKPFVEISCGALPREIIESELFGHTKGAFTGAIVDRKGRFELADGGTILLDDIDCLHLDLQVKLLRVLQHKEFERVGDNKTIKVDTRIIVSTNQDLEHAVAEKRFREDLYYRLNVISISVPPLRERKEDIPMLAEYFIKIYAEENHKKIKSVSDVLLSLLMNYNWPGNIRQLENVIERAVILDTDGIVEKDDLPETIVARNIYLSAESQDNIADHLASLKDALKEPEKVYILRILEEVGWNKKKAATKSGVNRTTLYNKLRKYNITSQPSQSKK